MKKISEVSFQNRFTQNLPGDDSGDPTPRATPGVCYSLVLPTAVKDQKLIGFSEDLGQQLGLLPPSEEKDLKTLSGSFVPETSRPFSLCYGGHQFGHWAGQLGDGRAITLGDFNDEAGHIWEIQLKGAGLTPYSRTADGKAVLRSSVREFLASEAMFHLGVPTTRALSLVTTGENVLRDLLYDGNVRAEPGAVVARAAPSFLRFGNFEILAAQNETAVLKKLIDWTISTHFPHLKDAGEKRIPFWFKEVAEKTAFLMTEWLRVGFVHGVMNTDNMSVLGLTMDYGPYGWLENYDPAWTPNTTDLPGRRYCFGRQAPIAFWNLQCLAGALSVLNVDVSEGLSHYHHSFESFFFKMMAKKLGLSSLTFEKDQEFLRELDDLLQTLQADMTLFYRRLSLWDPRQDAGLNDAAAVELLETAYSSPDASSVKRLSEWLEIYGEKILADTRSPENRRHHMNRTNPKYILRNFMAYLVDRELEEKKDDTLFQEIFRLLKHPYAEQSESAHWAAKRPEWAVNQPGSSTLSCSS